jgi:hypothetical protein
MCEITSIPKTLAGFMYKFAQAPRIAEVYNLGGGKQLPLHS